MKKRLMGLALAFMLLAPTIVFAEDALVLPARVGRVYAVPTFIHASQAFDVDGNRVDANTTNMFNLGFALEYGITSWITAAVQWTPGVNVWSNVDLGDGLEGRVSGRGDLFAGAKLQIMGPAAPITNNRFRLAFAPGVKIPLGRPDFSGEPAVLATGGTPNVARLDNHVFAFGLRSFFDFVITDFLFINLFNEVIFHPVSGRFGDLGLGQAAQAAAIGAATGMDIAGADVDFRYQLRFQIGPQFNHLFQAPLISFSAALPLTYVFTPGFTVADDARTVIMAAGQPDPNQGNVHNLFIRPNVSAFFMGLPLPMEFVLGYRIPLWGENVSAQHVVDFQIRFYFSF